MIALIPLAICFLGGGRTIFAKGIAASLIGLLLVLAPPNQRLPRALLAAILGVTLTPLLSFLPAAWLGPIPEWRNHLTADWGIVLPLTSTPQPFVTLEAWLLLTICMAWLAWCTSRGSTLSDRRIVLRCIVGGLVSIAILTLLNKSGAVAIQWWKFPTHLASNYGGPFANRNHTSSIMVLGSILCAAIAFDYYRSKQRNWMLALILLVPLFVVIISNTSRAGILLLFAGLSIWLLTASMRTGLFKKIALIIALAATGVSLVVIFGKPLTVRLTATLSPDAFTTSGERRVALYSDSVTITSKSPWTGMGLGNFSAAFPLNSSIHEPGVRFLHPESDWFWMMTEGGTPMCIAFLAMLLIFANMTGPWKGSRNDESSSRQDRRLRNAAAIAACIAALHGVVDVPNHSLGYGLFSGMLLALAVRSSKIREPALMLDKTVFRLAGIGSLAAGISWLGVAMGFPAVPSGSTAKLLAQQARELSDRGHDGTALKKFDKAIQMNPLDWTHYFQRARLHLRLNDSDQEAMMDFGRARAIEPNYATMCYDEGMIWLSFRPRFAIQAFKEFFRRDQDPWRTWYYYSKILKLVEGDPELRVEAGKLARTPQMKLTYLQSIVDPEEFANAFSDLIRQNSTLEEFQSQDRLTLFRLWQQRGDREALKSGLLKNLQWQQDGWRILCDELARTGDYEGAYRLAARHEQSPVSSSAPGLTDMNQLEQNFLFNPTDPRRGLDLYFAQKAKLQWREALATLDKVARLPNAPFYLNYEMATVYAQKQDYRKAWELMSQYLSVRKLP